MKALLAAGAGVLAVAASIFLASGWAADPGSAGPPAANSAESPDRLIVHEWGTFTTFSGSDGVQQPIWPNNTDLPDFIYPKKGPADARLYLKTDFVDVHHGTVIMETPVIYFYTGKETQASVRVDFPQGWITEWYPFAVRAPGSRSMRWNVKLLAGQAPNLPQSKGDNHYYRARETDAVPVQAEVVADKQNSSAQGGTAVQHEKFLFYRGVGTFPVPVTFRALAGGKVSVQNTTTDRIAGVVLVSVRDGAVGFQSLGKVEAGAKVEAKLPEANAKSAALADVMVKELTAAGLYEKEAQAMVKTWDSSWFGENGTRVFYLVPRTRTDELLPLTIEPKPAEVVRVLVGRHDFFTPEQESVIEQLALKTQAGKSWAELKPIEQEFQKIGRFASQAKQAHSAHLILGHMRRGYELSLDGASQKKLGAGVGSNAVPGQRSSTPQR